MSITFATFTHTGLMRSSNEDSFYARPPVFAVADGMGGARAGEVASAMAIQAFEYFLPQSKRPEAELAGLISRMNKSIYEYAMGDSGHPGMGTTITAATISGSSVAVAHVGDSRAWLLRDGRLSRLTEDHSLVAEMVREGQLTEAEAAEHPQRSVITRALGVEPEVEVDTSKIEWQPGDVFLLASDGLYGMVPETEIEAIMASGADLRELAEKLVEAANARGGTDNITVVLFSPDGAVPGVDAVGEDGAIASAASPPPEISNAEKGSGDPSGRPPRSRLRTIWGGVLFPALIGVALAALVLGGGWAGTRFVYFVGLNENKVAVYRGVPYDLGPLQLSSVYRSSSIEYKDLEPYEQDRVTAENLQSKESAEKMFDNLVVSDRQRKNEEQKRQEQAIKTTRSGTVTTPGGTP